jgi:hypothetical protein
MTRQRARRPTPTDDTPTLRVRGPADFLHAVPYLLGFHPRQSLVLIGLDGARVAVTTRLDLADVDSASLAHTVRAMVNGGAGSLVAALYVSVPEGFPILLDDEMPYDDVVLVLAGVAEALDCFLGEAYLVIGDRWWCYHGCGEEICPSEGHVLDHQASPVAASATFAGLVALPDREALERTLEPVDEPERERLRPQLDEACSRPSHEQEREARAVKRALFAAARRADTDGVELSDEQAVRFGSALRDIALRDALWMAVDDQRLDGSTLWRDLARRLPEPYDAAAWFLFGWGRWRAGNGALARSAAERALLSDPSYGAADLLLAALAKGVDPRRFPRLRRRPA